METLIEQARQAGKKINGVELRKIFVLVNGTPINLKGLSFLSCGDVLCKSDMAFLIETYKPDIRELDSAGCLALHYAAEYGYDQVFEMLQMEDVPLLFHRRKNDGANVFTILIRNNEVDILHKHLVLRLGISPFSSIFKDIHHTWFHEALSLGSSKVVFYLLKEHRLEIQKSLAARNANEKLTPFDVVLASENLSTAKRCLYVDKVLSGFEHGFRLKHHTPSQLLVYAAAARQISAMMSPVELIMKCFRDSTISMNEK